MPVVLNIAVIGIAALFLSIPLLNRVVFHTVDIEAIALRGYEGLTRTQELQKEGKFEDSRDSAWGLVEEFRYDTTCFFTGDVYDWNAFLRHAKAGGKAWGLIAEYLDDESQDSVLACSTATELSSVRRRQIVGILNRMKSETAFFTERRQLLDISEVRELKQRYDALESEGVFIAGPDGVGVRENPTGAQKMALERFNMVTIEKLLCPDFLRKDLKRGLDWASEYTVQTALYLIGSSYSLQFMLDRSIRTLDSLVELYPRTIYAEQVFLSNGQALLGEGKNLLTSRQKASADENFRRAIQYLEMIEKNREVARDFPKYRLADLNTDQFVNIDEASKAKRRVRQKTTVYTSAKAKQELTGQSGEDQSGYVLEDAVRLIGECYIQLGLTDSARSQFRLILDFFPESENLDDAQKLIADTYIKDGELILAASDSGDVRARAKGNESYDAGIKEYLKFFNLFPQSDLVSKTYISLADAYNKRGMPEDANRAFQSALARAKDTEEQAKIQLEIGTYYYERKRFVEASEAYQIILNNFSSTAVAPNAQYLIGECKDAMGDTAGSLEAYNVVVDYYKSSNFVGGSASKIASYHFGRGNYQIADSFYNSVLIYDKDGEFAARGQFQKGAVRQRLAASQEGDGKVAALKDAITEFLKVDKGWPGTREADQANVQIVRCYLEIGNEMAAREASRRIGGRQFALEAMKLIRVSSKDSGDGDVCQGDLDYWAGMVRDAIEDEERASAIYERGNAFLGECDAADSAMAHFLEVLSLTTDKMKMINARIGMARAHSVLKEFVAAQDTLLGLLDNKKVPPDVRPQLRIQLYDAYLRGGEADKAYEGFDRFATELPDHDRTPYAYYRLGTILGDREEYQRALDMFKTVTDRYGESDMVDEAALGIGTQMANLGQEKEAVKYLEDYMAANPDAGMAPRIYLKIGEILWKQLGDKTRALSAYRRIVDNYEDDPLFSFGAYQCGILLVEMERKDEAIEVFEEVKRTDKQIFRAAHAEIGKLSAKTDPEAAIGHYKEIVVESETQEDSATAMIGIGDVYVATEKWDQASKAFGDVYSFYQGNDTTLLGGALVKWVGALVNQKNFDEAIRVANIMEERFPDNLYTINTTYYKANAYFSTGNFSKAREVFARIIELNKSEQLTEIAYYQKADCHYFSAAKSKDQELQGRLFRNAVGEYNDYLKAYPKGKYRPRALFMQGNAYWTLGNATDEMAYFTKAKDNFQTLIGDYPDFAEICNARNLLAFSLGKLNQHREAIKIYNMVRNSKTCDEKTRKFADEQAEIITGSYR